MGLHDIYEFILGATIGISVDIIASNFYAENKTDKRLFFTAFIQLYAVIRILEIHNTFYFRSGLLATQTIIFKEALPSLNTFMKIALKI